MSNLAFMHPAAALSPAWSVRMADAVLARRPIAAARWHYEHGLLLKSLERVWRVTGDERYWAYIHAVMDAFLDQAGNIKPYTATEFNLDQINPGRNLFTLWRETGDPRYRHALEQLRTQLRWQPRTREGGFWHKLIYPHQIWLDGAYMVGPFLAEYAATFNEPEARDEVIRELILVEKHMRDPRTGLLYHGWDESRLQRWANPQTGCSPHFWGRAVGWYAMALVDVLDYLPATSSVGAGHAPAREGDDEGSPLRSFAYRQRETLIAILRRTMTAVLAVQDEASGVWFQILDQGSRPGNYLEASASCMFVYALLKGVRLGYLDASYGEAGQRGYAGLLRRFITVDEQDLVNLTNVCSVGGLGGNPYRDGSFEYYISEKIVANDYKGLGPFIMASVEMEALRIRGAE